jgi:hypothetical protein
MNNSLAKPDKKTFDIPVLIICYNRVQYIEEQMKQIRLVKPVNIFIACDGPKNSDDAIKVDKVRQQYLKLIDWECDIRTHFQETNRGCFKGVKGALDWFFNLNQEGIVIEDDIIPTTDFFLFMEVMLNAYRDNENIFCISGCNLGYRTTDSLFVSKIMNMWGWATWSNRYFDVDFKIASWERVSNKRWFLYKKLSSTCFDFDRKWIDYWISIFDEAVGNENYSTWDYQLIYNQIVTDKLTIYPGVNLVRNLGFHDDATHTKDNQHIAKELETHELNWPLRLPKKLKPNINFYEKYIKERWAYYKRPNWKYYLGTILKSIDLKR